MIRIENLNVNIGQVEILRDINLELPRGFMGGLLGRNGAGKTTLMRSLMGLLKPSKGRIFVEDVELTREPARRRAQIGIGYMPEDRRLIPTLTVRENILLPAWSTGARDHQKRMDWICERIPEVAQFLERSPMQLSGGQQKLVALARALMVGTKVLVLDEPSEGVAPALAERIEDVLLALRGTGLSVLIADSNTEATDEVFEHMYFIERGEMAHSSAAARDVKK